MVLGRGGVLSLYSQGSSANSSFPYDWIGSRRKAKYRSHLDLLFDIKMEPILDFSFILYVPFSNLKNYFQTTKILRDSLLYFYELCYLYMALSRTFISTIKLSFSASNSSLFWSDIKIGCSQRSPQVRPTRSERKLQMWSVCRCSILWHGHANISNDNCW